MQDPRPTRHRRTRTAALAVTATLVFATGACSDGDDSEAAYCDAWENTVDAYTALRALDVTAVGTEGLQTAVDDLESAINGLVEATQEQVGDDVERLRESVEQLVETVLSPELPVDRRDEVAAAIDDVRSAWDDVETALGADCPDVSVPPA